MGFPFVGNSLGNYDPACASNTKDDSFGFKFSADIRRLSFYMEVGDRLQRDRIELWHHGELVKNFSIFDVPYSVDNNCDGVCNFVVLPGLVAGYLNIDNYLFDEVRVLELGASGRSYTMLDNFGITSVDIPEPATSGIFAIAFLILLARIRRHPNIN